MKVVSMVKGAERFIFRYEHENEAFEAIMAMANHNDVGFDWQDASVMHNQVRQQEANSSPGIWDSMGGQWVRWDEVAKWLSFG